ncbi:urokinase-type plasminogen activator isoform X2 [Protopterus annectens]|uniref:urokinase-type plasminogen activator isoform X2 n=1 Tax=Protopterus annectens TaxID=7888 RepID=UPI001CFBA42D|nr:urokinase-type plasminogen activator isoform X2 [Protopterus annectens]
MSAKMKMIFLLAFFQPLFLGLSTGFPGRISIHRTKKTDTQTQCYKDNGAEYRGTVSKTLHGINCLEWNSLSVYSKPYSAYNSKAQQLGLGKHNYCRNPSNEEMPWCYVRYKNHIVEQFCDIGQCKAEPSSTCGQRKEKKFKIVGGGFTGTETQPWIAAIFKYSRRDRATFFRCGGTLIHPCWVVTAAHCFPDSQKPNDFTVALGKSNSNETREDREQMFEVERVIVHKDFSDSTGAYENDIALLQLKSINGGCSAETQYVRPACLPPWDLTLKDGWKCEIAGYGQEAATSYRYSQQLKEANVQIINQRTCSLEEYYGSLISDNMLCAGHPLWKEDACKGDSGGPLVCEKDERMIFYGIISWGDECAKQNKPGVYTRVTRYIDWIEINMSNNPPK